MARKDYGSDGSDGSIQEAGADPVAPVALTGEDRIAALELKFETLVKELLRHVALRLDPPSDE